MRDAFLSTGFWSRLFGRRAAPPPAVPSIDPTARELRDLLERVQSENIRLRRLQPARVDPQPSLGHRVGDPLLGELQVKLARETNRAAAEVQRNQQLQAELLQAQRQLSAMSGALKDPKKWSASFRAEREAASDKMHIEIRGPRTLRQVNAAVQVLREGAALAVQLRFDPGQELEVSFDDERRPRQLFRSRAAEVRLGRGSDNDLVLTDDRVSRAHAALRRLDDHLQLLDLDSSNGTGVLSDGVNELVFVVGGGTIRVRPVAP